LSRLEDAESQEPRAISRAKNKADALKSQSQATEPTRVLKVSFMSSSV